MSLCKKTLSFILAAAIIFSILLVPVSAAYENTYTNTGDGATDILGVAATQVGYYDGGNNDTKYGIWYEMNYNPWCAMFVSWCADQAGISTEVIPKFASCSAGMNWFIDRGRWESSDYTPKAGDLIFFEFDGKPENGPDHVGIVRYTSGNTIYTIEGNTSNDMVEYKTRSKDSSVVGFAVPNYATKSVSTTGIYKVATSSSSLTIRSGAGTNYSSVGSIPKDTLINILSFSGSWGKVNYDGISGYVSMAYCSLVTPFIDFGDNFYAYIIQAEKWKHLENAGNNVQIAAGGNDTQAPRQIWQFKKQSDGSYAVMNCYNNSYLDNCESVAGNGNNIQSWPGYHGGDNQRWYLTEGGYIVSKNGNAMVLDIENNNISAGANVQLYQLNMTGAQKFSVYKLTNDGVQYQKPAKPDAPTLSVTSPVTVNTNTTFNWTASPLKSSSYDHRSYTVKVWEPNGSLLLNKTGITETSLLVQFAGTGTFTIQVAAVNDKYEDYYAESSKATVVVQAAHTHSYSYKATTSPTTSTTGVLTGTCSCGVTTTVTLPKLDTTNYTYQVIKAATCTATGTGRYTWKTTTYGSYYFDVTIAKTSHNYTTTVTAPTCTAQGYTTHTCTACGDSYKDTFTAALGHNYNYQVTFNPTFFMSGMLNGTCSRCSSGITVTLPKLNTTDYDYSVVKAATCTETGTGRYTWKSTTYGSYYFDVTIEKTAHNYTTTVTAPTCTAQGYTTHTCITCGDSYVDSYVDALEHSFNYVDNGDGTHTAACSACGYSVANNAHIDKNNNEKCDYCNADMSAALPQDEKIATNNVEFSIKNEQGERIVRSQETNLGDFAADALYYLFNVTEGIECDAAIISGGTIRADLPKGDVTYKSCQSVHSFGNMACLVTVTGQQIIDALEWGAKNVGSGEDGSFLQVSGITYEIHCYIPSTVQQKNGIWTGAPTGKYRVQNVKIYDKSLNKYVPVDPSAKYNLAGYDYILSDKNDGFYMFEDVASVEGNVSKDYLVLANYAKSFPNATIDYTNSVLNADYGNIEGEGRIKIVTNECDHIWNQGEITSAPTSTEPGVKTFVCTICGATRTETIPATGGQPDQPDQPDQPEQPEQPGKPNQPNQPDQPGKLCDGGADCPGRKFVDVSAKAWYHLAVDFAVERGLFGGTSANTFEPDAPMTRAMLVTVLWRYEGKPAAPANTFSDVKAGTWYSDAVSWASANGVVNGVGGNRFDPDGNITREQMAAILYRYCNGKGIDTSKRGSLSGFPDAGKVSSYAQTAMQWTVAEGIIGGSDGMLLPQGNATRAQVATILMRFIENISPAEEEDEPDALRAYKEACDFYMKWVDGGGHAWQGPSDDYVETYELGNVSTNTFDYYGTHCRTYDENITTVEQLRAGLNSHFTSECADDFFKRLDPIESNGRLFTYYGGGWGADWSGIDTIESVEKVSDHTYEMSVIGNGNGGRISGKVGFEYVDGEYHFYPIGDFDGYPGEFAFYLSTYELTWPSDLDDDQDAEAEDTEPLKSIKVEVVPDDDNDCVSVDGKSVMDLNLETLFVEIPGNDAAAQKIMDTFQTLKESIRSHWEEQCKDMSASASEFGMFDELKLSVYRADQNVISVFALETTYLGGNLCTHGIIGKTFSSHSGEELQLADLTDNVRDLKQQLHDSCWEQFQNDPDYSVIAWNKEGFDSVFENEKYEWTLDDLGIHVYFPEYSVGSHASGIIEFVVPYGELTLNDMISDNAGDHTGSEETTGHRYEFVISNCSWQEAQSAAKARGGYLVNFNTLQEYTSVLTQIEAQGYHDVHFRIGGMRSEDSREYYWVDADGAFYGECLNASGAWCLAQWQEGEPNFEWESVKEEYMEIYFSEDENRWVWNDVKNQLTFPKDPEKIGYIVEYDTP